MLALCVPQREYRAFHILREGKEGAVRTLKTFRGGPLGSVVREHKTTTCFYETWTSMTITGILGGEWTHKLDVARNSTLSRASALITVYRAASLSRMVDRIRWAFVRRFWTCSDSRVECRRVCGAPASRRSLLRPLKPSLKQPRAKKQSDIFRNFAIAVLTLSKGQTSGTKGQYSS